MKKEPKISVALATYNGSRYIEEQLNSILNQQYSVNEIIIVDDCSTDNTVEILYKIKRSYNKDVEIKILENDKNLGVVPTFKKAVQNTNGDIIFLSDQDDIWYIDKVKTTIDIFKEKDILLVCSGYNLINEKGKLINKKLYPNNKSGDIKFESIMKGNSFPGCTVAFKKQIKTYINLMDEMVYIHDWYIIIIASMLNKAYYINKPLIGYRIHANNTIGKNVTLKTSSIKAKKLDALMKNVVFYDSINSLNKKIIGNEISSIQIGLVDELKRFNKSRYDYIKNRNIVKLFFYGVNNMKKYKSLRLFIGDIVYATKQ